MKYRNGIKFGCLFVIIIILALPIDCSATEGTDLLNMASEFYTKAELLKARKKVDEAIAKLYVDLSSNIKTKKYLSQAHFLKAEILLAQQADKSKIKAELTSAMMIDPQYVSTIDQNSMKPEMKGILLEVKGDIIEQINKNMMIPAQASPKQQLQNQTQGQRHRLAIVPIILKDAYIDEPPRSIKKALITQISSNLVNTIKSADAFIIEEEKASALKSKLAIKDYDQFVMGPDKPVGMGDIDLKDINSGEVISKIGFLSLPEPYMMKFIQLYKQLNADSILLVSIYNYLSYSSPYYIQVYYCYYTKQDKVKPFLRDSTILEDPKEIMPYVDRLARKLDAYHRALEEK